ncbi:MAG: quinolinate synthase NadA [Flavobacteriia bacterium]|nr:quinolinate synthase NadA [Flavobacteriia bacterium]
MPKEQIIAEIKKLKKEKNVLILAHYYQDKDIQDLADFVGDSYNLSVKAAETSQDIILFCGVHFMAETAKILNPNKKVILPDTNAGCSLASSCTYEEFNAFKALHPNAVVVTYINCTADIKTLSDYICTSSNAVKIVNSIPLDKDIIFAPDKNLGAYVQKECNRPLILWNGTCIVHEAFSFQKVLNLYLENPNSKIIAHPESEAHILEMAHFIGSTSAMIQFMKTDNTKTYIIATEAGILHQLEKEIPHKKLIPAPIHEENTCACSECAFMKVNTLEKVLNCLKNEVPEIILDKETMDKARLPLQRMIELCKS